MRDFAPQGTALTGIVPVNSNVVDDHPDVAASNGSFVITWSQRYSDSDFDIYAERFVISSGGVPSPKGIFGVNADTASRGFPQHCHVTQRGLRHRLSTEVQQRQQRYSHAPV